MINYTKHFIDDKDIRSVVNVLKNKNITQGTEIGKFEKALCNYFGAKDSVVVNNATMALYLLAKALNWKKNDHVICSPMSFLSASNAVLISGAKPEFVDIDFETGNLSIEEVKNKIKTLKKNKKKIKAIIAVDYGGLPSDWRELQKIGKKNNITLINDNCHAMGASYYNSKQYAVKHADFVIQSYHAAKNITTGEGGSIISNDKKLLSKLRSLRSHGVTKKSDIFPWYYQMNELSYNARITDFQCALGISQLKKLNRFVNKRILIANTYIKIFKNERNLELPFVSKNKKNAYHLFPIKINFENLSISKKQLFNILRAKFKINLQVHYIPIFNQPYYKKTLKIDTSKFKNTILFYNLVLCLPMYYSLSITKVKKIAFTLKKILKQYAK